MDTFSAVTQSFATAFTGFSHQFLVWGQIIFGSLLVLNFSWMCLWYAFDKDCFTKSLSSFFKRFMTIMIFYTIMVNPNWLFSVLSTVHFMGKEITGIPLDPSSVISKGIALSNKMIAPIATSSLLTVGYSAVIILIAYLVINFTFITIALELALTLITTTALISISALFLGFSALSATSNIARQTLDIILGNCFRILGIYLVVGAGSKTIDTITEAIPVELVSFDQYVWVVASCLLFWLLAKNLPNQLGRIASIAMQDNQGTDSVALATSSLRMGSQAGHVAKVAQTAFSASGIPQMAKMAASTAYNAVMQVAKNKQSGSSLGASVAKGSIAASVDVAQATLKTLGDHVAQVANKSVGGQGIAKSHAHISSVAERIYHSAEEARMQTPYRQSTMHGTADSLNPSQQSNTHSCEVAGDINKESPGRPDRSQLDKGEDSITNQVSSENQSDNSVQGFNEDINKLNESLTKPSSEQSSHFKTQSEASPKNQGNESAYPKGSPESRTHTQSVADHQPELQSPWNQLPTNQEG